MDVREFTVQAMEINRGMTLDAIQGLTDEEYRWMDNPNPICFLLLHIARMEDRHVHRWIAGSQQIWERDGWQERTGLVCSESPKEAGNSWTVEEVRNFPYPSLDELVNYMAQVRESALRVVRDLDISRISDVPRPAVPTWTVATYLQRIIVHEAQHLGNMDYARGVWARRTP